MTPAKIAGRLTEADRRAVVYLGGEWQAGPDLPDCVTDGPLKSLREMGLVEREFGDLSYGNKVSVDGISMTLHACWWFHLTPLGIEVHTLLTGEA